MESYLRVRQMSQGPVLFATSQSEVLANQEKTPYPAAAEAGHSRECQLPRELVLVLWPDRLRLAALTCGCSGGLLHACVYHILKSLVNRAGHDLLKPRCIAKSAT
eukprot:scpid98867/ scgid13355/ 